MNGPNFPTLSLSLSPYLLHFFLVPCSTPSPSPSPPLGHGRARAAPATSAPRQPLHQPWPASSGPPLSPVVSMAPRQPPNPNLTESSPEPRLSLRRKRGSEDLGEEKIWVRRGLVSSRWSLVFPKIYLTLSVCKKMLQWRGID